jgi:hypothetical protein
MREPIQRKELIIEVNKKEELNNKSMTDLLTNGATTKT